MKTVEVLEKKKKIPKKVVALGLAGVSAVTAIVFALNSTLAADAVDEKFGKPNHSYEYVAAYQKLPHRLRGALTTDVDGSVIQRGSWYEDGSGGYVNGATDEFIVAIENGIGTVTVTTKKFTKTLSYQVFSDYFPTGYRFPLGLSGRAELGDAEFVIDYGVYTGEGYTFSNDSIARSKIVWSNPTGFPLEFFGDHIEFDTASPNYKAASVPLLGTIKDRYGAVHQVVYTLGIGKNPVTAELGRLQAAIARAEEIEALSASVSGYLYTKDSQDQMTQDKVSGVALITANETSPVILDAAADAIWNAILNLVDLAELRRVINEADGWLAHESAYTIVTVDVLKLARADGYALYFDAGTGMATPTQVEVNAAVQVVQDAINGLDELQGYAPVEHGLGSRGWNVPPAWIQQDNIVGITIVNMDVDGGIPSYIDGKSVYAVDVDITDNSITVPPTGYTLNKVKALLTGWLVAMHGYGTNWYDVYVAGKGGVVAESDSLKGLFYSGDPNIPSGELLERVDMLKLRVGDTTDISRMFRNSPVLTDVRMWTWDTSNVIAMDEMFMDCVSLEELNLRSFTSAPGCTLTGMFKGCTNLKLLDMRSFDFTKAGDLSEMFDGVNQVVVTVKDGAQKAYMDSLFPGSNVSFVLG